MSKSWNEDELAQELVELEASGGYNRRSDDQLSGLWHLVALAAILTAFVIMWVTVLA